MVLLSSWVEVAQWGNRIILQEDQENPGPDLWGKWLTFQELEMALKRAAYIMNSLPMSAICCMKGGVDPDFITELTPNMLLLGRGYFSNIQFVYPPPTPPPPSTPSRMW